MREYINNNPILNRQEFINLNINKIYGYIEGDLPEDCFGRKFYYKNNLYGLEYRSGCFYPFLIFLQNDKQEIPSGRITLGIFQQI